MLRMNRETRKKILRTFFRNKGALVGLLLSVLVVLISLLAPFIAPHDPLEQNIRDRLKPPGGKYLLGTDDFGRDILSRILYASRVSLTVGVLAVLLSMVIGMGIGMIAGFKGGKLDAILIGMVDILMSFPTLIMGLILMVAFGRGLSNVILAIGITVAPRFARMSRGSVLSIKENDYVNAARTLGISDARIVVRHILPNILGDMIVVGTLWVGAAILTEASLSFIGLGVPPPIPSWGRMIREGMDFIDTAPWISMYTGLANLITVLGFNMLGDGLRDIIDPKLRS
jgi:peptide/nickel transport system permease protein